MMMRKPDFVDECYAGKDLSLLKKLTLVIPTYNRNYYLSRCLWYHAHFPFGEIIVADSSPEEKKVVNRETVAKVMETFGANVRYLEYDFPEEEYGGEIYRKWGDAVQHVDTEYSLSCTDKEFLIPTTLVSSMQYLDQHPDYSIADGIYYIIESKKVIHPWQGDISITSDDPSIRLNEICDAKVPVGTQFALRRSVSYKQIFEMIAKYELYDIRIGETAIETLPVIFGKLHREATLPMSFRDSTHNSENHWLKKQQKKDESSYLRYLFIYDYPEPYRKMIVKKLYYCLKDNISDEKMFDIQLDYCDSLLAQRYGKTDFRSPLLDNWRFLQYLWSSILPYGIKEKISHYIGGGVATPAVKNKDLSREILTIRNIIFKTSEHYADDSSMFSSLRENILVIL